MPTHESENFHRIITLLVNVCTPILRRLLVNYAQQYVTSSTSGVTSSGTVSGDVYAFVVNHQGVIMQLHKKKIIRQEQLKRLLPSSGGSLDVEKWDISLLTTLLKEICPITNIEMSEIDTLRQTRNAIFAHQGSASMTLSDFTTQWHVIEASALALLQSIGDSVLEKENNILIQKIKTGPLDIGGTTAALTTWYQENMEVTGKLESMENKMADIADQVSKMASVASQSLDPVFQTITRQSQALLEAAKQSVFVQTSQFEEARQMLTSDHVVLLLGSDGDGKTLLGQQLMLHYYNQDNCVMLQDVTLLEHVDTNKVQIVLIDDIFGKITDTEIKLPLPIFDIIQSLVTSRTINVIMTSRRYIFETVKSDLSRYDVFSHIVNLSSDCLSIQERNMILSAHLVAQNRTVRDSHIKDCCSSYDMSFGFMQHCSLFAKKSEIFQKGASSFSLPIEYLINVLKSLSRIQFLSVLLLFYEHNRIIDLDLKPTRRKDSDRLLPKIRELSESVGIRDGVVSKSMVKECLNSLTTTFVINRSGEFSFRSRAIYICVGLLHGKDYLEEVLEVCDLKFLCENINCNQPCQEKLCVGPDYYDILVDRIITEVSEHGVKEEIAKHTLLLDKQFCQHLVDELNGRECLRRFLGTDEGTNVQNEPFLCVFLKCHLDFECDHLLQAVLGQLHHDHVLQKADMCDITSDGNNACISWQCLLLGECLAICSSYDRTTCIDAILLSKIMCPSDTLLLSVRYGQLESVELLINVFRKDGTLTKNICERSLSEARASAKQDVERVLIHSITQFGNND